MDRVLGYLTSRQIRQTAWQGQTIYALRSIPTVLLPKSPEALRQGTGQKAAARWQDKMPPVKNAQHVRPTGKERADLGGPGAHVASK